MALRWEFAERASHDQDFAEFACWDGRSGRPWIEETENYVRGWVLREATHVLAFRDRAGALLAVAAFDEHAVAVPLVEPVEQPAWLLRVIAIDLEHQRTGLSAQVFAGTFEAMREVDHDRVLVIARAHRRNRASLAACKSVEMLPFRAIDEHYLELLGEVPAG